MRACVCDGWRSVVSAATDVSEDPQQHLPPCTLLLKTELHMHVHTHTQDCPKQFDGVSCGVFVCCFADCLSGDASLLRCARVRL